MIVFFFSPNSPGVVVEFPESMIFEMPWVAFHSLVRAFNFPVLSTHLRLLLPPFSLREIEQFAIFSVLPPSIPLLLLYFFTSFPERLEMARFSRPPSLRKRDFVFLLPERKLAQ